jgi:hypothetical protein
MEPILGEAHSKRVLAAINLPPEKQHDIPTVDAANVEAARLIEEFAKLSPNPKPPSGAAESGNA